MKQQFSAADKVLLLLSLVPYLHANGPTSITDLSTEFGAAPSVLRKLARFLGTAGLPGETLTYQANDLFDIDWTALEEHDEVHLVNVVACEDAPRFSRTEVAALLAGIQSLIPALPKELTAVAHTTSEKLAALAGSNDDLLSVSLAPEPVTQALALVGEGISKKRRMSFDYRDRSGATTSREVDPDEVAQVRGEWYLYGYCHTRQADRIFRIESMSQVTVLHDQEATRLRNLEQRVQPKHAHSETRNAQILVQPEAMYLLDGWDPQTIETLPDGKVRAEVSLAYDASVIDLVTVAPGLIEVEAPIALRELVETWLLGLQVIAVDSSSFK